MNREHLAETAFNLFDTNHDGVIRGSELRLFVAFNFNKSPHEVTDEEVDVFMRGLDSSPENLSLDLFKDMFVNGSKTC